MAGVAGSPSSVARKVFYVAPDDPWSRWTNSGVSRALARGLKERGLLAGAISRHALDQRHLMGKPAPAFWLERAMRRLRSQPQVETWSDERSGVVGEALRRLPAGTGVLYHYIFPKIDRSLPIRRFLFQDMTVIDAVRTGTYGHGSFTPEQLREKQDQQRRSIDECDGVVVFSTYGVESICEACGCPREKVVAIGAAPINPARGEPPLSIERYREAHVLFVGRAWERKGGPTLIEAWPEVRRAVPHARLTVVNPAPGLSGVAGLTQIPFASHAQLRALYAGASVFCMPALAETWGLVYTEAARSGLPIVGFDAWAMPDIVDHGVSGLLTPDLTARGIAASLIEALRDPERLARMGRAAVARVRDVLEWPHVLDRLVGVMSPEALNGRTPAPLRRADADRGAAPSGGAPAGARGA